jgi:hypothetical protein
LALSGLKPWAIALAATLLGLPVASPLRGQTSRVAAPDLSDQGTFEIFSAGKSIGSETFQIRSRSDRIEASGEGHLKVEQDGKKFEVQTTSNLVLDAALDPLTYSWSQKGTQSSQLSIDFRSKLAHARYKQVNGQDDRRDFRLDKDVIVLDDNVVHHYELALARYDEAKRGIQVFRGFIPQEALPGVITLNFVGREPVNVNGEKVTLRHFLLTAELAQINLWADDRGHLQLVSSMDTQFQAVRKKE